jgi:hypothetical protein
LPSGFLYPGIDADVARDLPQRAFLNGRLGSPQPLQLVNFVLSGSFYTFLPISTKSNQTFSRNDITFVDFSIARQLKLPNANAEVNAWCVSIRAFLRCSNPQPEEKP